MVKIVKTLLPKHRETMSPFIQEFVQTASTTPLQLLPQKLREFPSRWPFPRGDLYHWIPLLNRFDLVLDSFCRLYSLQDGPQTREFACELLADGQESYNLQELGYQEDGDRQLIESILDFSRMLLENCGNRSIYASSPYLSDLLNSTSLSLVASTLQIGTQLAQRYQASFKRMAAPPRHANAALLQNHYNIDLDRVQQLSQPFVKISTSTEPIIPSTPVTPGTKGKEKSLFGTPTPSHKNLVTTFYANDLVSLVKSEPTLNSNGQKGAAPSVEAEWKDWGDVRLTYYPSPPPVPSQDDQHEISIPMPETPTPVRRASNLGHQHGQRSSRLSGNEDLASPPSRSAPSQVTEVQSTSVKAFEISKSRISLATVPQLLKETLPSVPATSHYELLTKVRAAKALTTSLETRRQMLAVRILAITNLAYIHTEPVFLEKVLKQDGEEPRRLQLIYQLAELIHPPADDNIGIPRSLQTIALTCLEALAQHSSKFQDICTALNTNVNHGVLLYIVRKAVAEMATDEPGEVITEKDEWRGALISLVSHVATLPHAGSQLVAAGLVPLLIEVLTLRTTTAEHNYPKVLNFLDAVIFNVRDAFGILVSSEGLDAISSLIIHEVKTAFENQAAGKGMSAEFRSPSIDYEIPFFQQQSIKWLFKFIHHMMTTAGGYGGNFDRLLRNLMDSPLLLSSLRQIIGSASCFGSTVWTNAISILNDFINNEPASFNVIAEAGLSRGLLEAITGQEIKIDDEAKEVPSQESSVDDPSSPAQTEDESTLSIVADEIPHPPTEAMLCAPREGALAQGIPPSSEAINIIPQAFGALCLNDSGMKMFKASNALQSFFEIFESSAHVQCLENDLNLTTALGASFDELVRHHPPLKTSIMNATLDMVARVGYLCKKKIAEGKAGAKLWTTNSNGVVVIADNTSASSQDTGKAPASDMDVEMSDVSDKVAGSPDDPNATAEEPIDSTTPYISAVATFLSTMFSNSGVRSAFMEKGGIEFVLDLAELPVVPYSFQDDRASRTLHSVIGQLAEQKPHIIMPSLLKRAQAACDALDSLNEQKTNQAYFSQFVITSSAVGMTEVGDSITKGTKMVESLVRAQSLANAIRVCFQTPMYSHRSSIATFNSTNLADYYVRLVKSLGTLLGASTREDFLLQNSVPQSWRRARRQNKDGIALDDETQYTNQDVALSVIEAAEAAFNNTLNSDPSTAPEITENAVIKPLEPTKTDQKLTTQETQTAEYKNYQILHFLLGKMPRTVCPLFQTLGKALAPKRSNDHFQRQNYFLIADGLAEAILKEMIPPVSLGWEETSSQTFTYWVMMLEAVKDLLINSSRHSDRPYECIIFVLQAFKARKGFGVLNHMLNVFAGVLKTSAEASSTPKTSAELVLNNIATLGARHILDLYLLLVTGKNVVEASQTVAMVSLARSERDKSKPDYFSPGQFLVELRMAILPVIRSLWESDIVEKGPNAIPKRLIDIIRATATADQEHGANKQSEKIAIRGKTSRRLWKPNQETLTRLVDTGFDHDLATEALFRCNNNLPQATEYCRTQASEHSGGRNPIPAEDLDLSTEGTGHTRTNTGLSTGTATPDSHVMQVDEAVSEPFPIPSQDMGPPSVPAPLALNESLGDSILENFNNLPNDINQTVQSSTSSTGTPTMSRDTPPSPSQGSITLAIGMPQVTIEDLDAEREEIRARLIDRCLDVINAHGEYTFEIAELITTVVDKSPDSITMRKEMGETLVNALMSFVGEEDVRAVGKKVAAYAHLLALMLQDRPFYLAAVDELKSNLETLLDFVTISPVHSAEASSPWIAHILLIIEVLLSEDAQPVETQWKGPSSETSILEKPILKFVDRVVSVEQRSILFESILEILPRIGKDESLALAVLRILVILTRDRELAHIMGEKKNIQRLFVMAKQLAGASSIRLQSPLMVILRHIIEDQETVKQIMRSEIKAIFDGARTQRLDVSGFLRLSSHLIIRAPELFVEASNEMLKLARWTSAAAEAPSRERLELQDQYRPGRHRVDNVLPTLQATEELSLQDSEVIKPTTETNDKQTAEAPKQVTAEHKVPVIENPDGVIHFLLCELLNYRDVDDKDPIPQPPEKTNAESSAVTDTTMTDVTPSSEEPTTTEAKDTKKPAKQEFKPEEHPIYIYRCFLLQCLTELLSCYNRTKVEFINFKRSAPPQAMTPSKPRSSVVNYLLFDLIPVGTLDHAEMTTMRKKLATSSWADSVITALLSKTGEQIMDKDDDSLNCEDEPDLFFVRKFVLENILKAYKEASTSYESLDIKYSRMLSLADLMSHIMSGKDNHGGGSDQDVSPRSQAQLRRIMFDKGFIAALTSSIADIDLNFPGAKRAVKHILKPLKVLTHTAIELSDAGKIVSSTGQNDEDEIASASSVSEMDDEREETPDLFRNSTLGMFEPGRDHESSSGSEDDDEEMYDHEEGYGDEEMDYEEEIDGDDEDNISDDDEDLEAMGEIEGLPGEHGIDVEVVMDGDDDEDPSDDDDDEDSEDMDDDDDEHVEIIDEDGNPHEMDEGEDEDDWQSDEDDEDDYEGMAADEEEERLDDLTNGPLSHLVRALGTADDGGVGAMLQRIEDGDMDPEEMDMGGYLEDAQDEEEDEEDDEDMEEDDDGIYDDYPIAPPGMAFEWHGDEAEPPMVIHRGHRPRHGIIPSPFPFFPGRPARDPLGGTSPSLQQQIREFENQLSATERAFESFERIISDLLPLPLDRTNPTSVPDYRGSYRSHRPGSTPRGIDDGTNPLLQRSAAGHGESASGAAGSLRQVGLLDLASGRRGPFGENSVALLNDLITSLPMTTGALARHGHALHFHVTGGPRGEMSRDLQAMFGMTRGLTRYDNRRDTVEPGRAAFFTPQLTATRWTEEAKLLFGSNHHLKAFRILNGFTAALIPPAWEAEKKASQERKVVEEKQRALLEERMAKEKKEAEEKAAQDKLEAEEKAANERIKAEEAAAAAAAGNAQAELQGEGASDTIEGQTMEGIEATSPDVAPESTEESAPAADRPRLTTIIRGREIDITDLDMDPTFLEELPEDIREEVIASAVAERRSQAAAAGSQPSEIDQEFLNALPDEIREEIMQQERQDRRRREREEQRRQAATNAGGGAPAPQEMDAASILATLPAALRAQVLAEQDEDVLAQLGQDYVEQANAFSREHGISNARNVSGGRPRPPVAGTDQVIVKAPRRSIVQMLDKSGVATLLRLMFIVQQDSLRNTLFQVLQNISENRHSRGEVISTILHILQDGSADMTAVERSFAHLSLRAKQPKDKEPKTPQPPKRMLTGNALNTGTNANAEVSPLMVVQQCLGTLVYLCKVNQHVPGFFLMEHDTSNTGLKRSVSRKGKAKDSKALKYPLNSLLTLLDRKLIMESSSVMESLSDLLSRITNPLQALDRKQKEAADGAKSEVSQSAIESLDATEPPAVSAIENVLPDVEVPAHTQGADSGTTAETDQLESEVVKEVDRKKQRPFLLPHIPEENLKLVINIFVARECSARTFRETLSTIKNLSCIPGAKATFGRELVRKAQELGEVILVDLDELTPQIQKASTGTEIQGVALSNFSPSSSDQHKLLRVLTALDHLFDRKQATKKDTEVGGDKKADDESLKDMEKQDLLATLYDNSTFGTMWEKLSACLIAIRQREHMLNVATILLPLIESLMVVCKNSTDNNTSVLRTQLGKEMVLTSPPPESRMESLFFTFTEDHRKILNDLVRHNPKLMSGTFSLLVKNPKVLDFDNKRNYFTRSVHNRNSPTRQSFPPLQLSVRREQVFHDSFKSLYFKSADEMKFGKLSIRFHGEEGVDAGGVTREWFQVLSRQMFDPGYALFVPVSSDRTTFHPNHMSGINGEHLMFFKFIGRVIGKALYEGRVLDCHFSRAVYKRILGKAVSVKDMESLDPEYYKSVVWMLENDITDIITETFSVDNDNFGLTETVDLVENGRNIPVTQENKQEYIRLMVEFKLTGSVQQQLDEFLKGFHEIIPAELVAIFNEQELELLISGLPEIDVDDWKSNTEYHNYSAASPQIQWFWRAIRSFDKEERAKLMQFVTGTSKVPLNGFKELEGMNGFSRFNIHRDYGNKDRLPSSHTCFNQLDLPEYESYEILRQQVHTAITAGSEYFGFA